MTQSSNGTRAKYMILEVGQVIVFGYVEFCPVRGPVQGGSTVQGAGTVFQTKNKSWWMKPM